MLNGHSYNTPSAAKESIYVSFRRIFNYFQSKILKLHLILRQKMVSIFLLSAAPWYDTAIYGRLVLKADQDGLKQETHPQVQFSLVP